MKINENDIIKLRPVKSITLEHKIYVNYAFSERIREKQIINDSIYRELTLKIKISYNPNEKSEMIDLVLSVKYLPYEIQYKVIKNTKNLSNDEIALIVSNGNLSFGYSFNVDYGSIWLI